jgi:hypothetical protein
LAAADVALAKAVTERASAEQKLRLDMADLEASRSDMSDLTRRELSLRARAALLKARADADPQPPVSAELESVLADLAAARATGSAATKAAVPDSGPAVPEPEVPAEPAAEPPASAPGPMGTPIQTSDSSNRCLGLHGAEGVDGAKVTTAGCAGGANQRWKYTPQTKQLVEESSGKCLDLPGGDHTNGSQLHLWTCMADNPNQNWEFLANGEIRKPGTNKCVDDAGSSKVTLHDCHSGQNQKWAVQSPETYGSSGKWAAATPLKRRVWKWTGIGPDTPLPAARAPEEPPAPAPIHEGEGLGGSNNRWWSSSPIQMSAAPNMCVGAHVSKRVNGSKVTTVKCGSGGSSATQRWSYLPETRQLKEETSGKCLDLPGGDLTNGSHLHIWECDARNPNQQWQVLDNGEIRKPGTNKCVDNDGASMADFAKVTLYDCHGGANQKWVVNSRPLPETYGSSGRWAGATSAQRVQWALKGITDRTPI